MSEELIKAEKDYSTILDTELPEIEKLYISDSDSALNQLLVLEKKVRQASDLASSQRVLAEVVRVLRRNKQWKQMNETVQVLAKKHGQLKTAIVALIQEVIAGLDEAPDLDTKLETIDTILTISEGKIYLELEQARMVRTLAEIEVSKGNVAKAADLMGELQIETVGSMGFKEKTDFILEQMSLYLRKGDYTLAQIVSRKILPKYFNDTSDKEIQEQKIRYYELNIELALHQNAYLDVCLHFQHIYDTPLVEEARRQDTLQNMVLFTILASFDNLQQDMLHHLEMNNELHALALYEQLVKMFTMSELIRWPKVEQVYGDKLKELWVFNGNPIPYFTATQASASGGKEAGDKRWTDLRDRVIEHNIRVVAKFYTRVTIDGLGVLLDLSCTETERFLAKLVTEKIVYARINRPQRIISFEQPKEITDTLNEWSNNTDRLLAHIETIGHLIAKEEMVHGMVKARDA